ncbi:MAG: cyclase family protein [Thermoguttaceae bacterium]|nr:cyclase family protein [Thermoguttaceae bacterium]MDW8077528.1 cyclase family protein [Thermoguttaceae bacterium]
MPRIIDLSQPLFNGMASYPGDPPFRAEEFRTMASHGVRVTQLSLGTHQGTHLDAPAHFYSSGVTVDAIPLERFYGPACLVDLAPGGSLPARTPISVEMLEPHREKFQAGARVIVRTGWDQMVGKEGYFTDLPSLTLEAAKWIAEKKIWLLGLDLPTPSKIAGRPVHYALLEPGVEIVLLEGLVNLAELPEQFILASFPLRLVGGDGSPVRAVAIVE